MFQKFQLTFIIIFSLLGHLSAQAQTSTGSGSSGTDSQVSVSIEEKAPEKKDEKPWTVALAMSKSRSLFVTGDGADAESVDASVSASLKVSEQIKIGMLIERGLDEKTGQADWGRVQFSNTFKKIESQYADVSPRVTLGLPASKLDAATSLRFRTSASSRMTFKTGLPKVDLEYTPSFGYANFAYETNEFTGNPNSQFSFSQDLTAGYNFNDKLSAKVSVVYLVQRTTSGFIKEAWTHSQELSWKAADHWALALGHQFGVPYASTRTASQDLNLAFINDKDSVVYSSLTVDF